MVPPAVFGDSSNTIQACAVQYPLSRTLCVRRFKLDKSAIGLVDLVNHKLLDVLHCQRDPPGAAT